MAQSKRFRKALESYDPKKKHTVDEAVKIVKGWATTKFDQSVEVVLKLGEQRSPLDAADLGTLVGLMGDIRSDIYRGQNARHLLGNYPTAFNRAGYEAYQAARGRDPR